MDRLSFLIELYHKENERLYLLNSSLSIPIGIVMGLLPVFYFMLKEFSFKIEQNYWIENTFILFISISIICWLLTIYLLFMSSNHPFKGYKYGRIPKPKILNKYYDELQNTYKIKKYKVGQYKSVNLIYEEEFYKILSKIMDKNLFNNNVKSGYLNKAKNCLLICIISIILCATPFIIHQKDISNAKTNNKIEIRYLYEHNKII